MKEHGKTFYEIDSDKLKYDLSVPQVQTYAMHMGASYYVLTNGKEFLWFETDDDGRPSKIEPVPFADNTSDNALDVNINEARAFTSI